MHSPKKVHLLPMVEDSGKLLGVVASWNLIKEILI